MWALSVTPLHFEGKEKPPVIGRGLSGVGGGLGWLSGVDFAVDGGFGFGWCAEA